MPETGNSSILFELDGGMPPLPEALPLAMQHVVAMVVGCITPAILISAVTKQSPENSVILIQASLVLAAAASAVQAYPLFGRLGARLPLIMGASFAYVPVLMAIGGQFGLAAIFGAQIAGGLTAVLVGLFIKRLRPLFPPIVTGTVVFTIGLSLYPVAIRYMGGGAGGADFGSARNWGVALFTLGATLFFSHFVKGFMKLASVLLGLLAGYLLSCALGMVGFAQVTAAGWVQLPKPFYFPIEFQLTAVLSMVIMFIVNSIQAIGDISATTVGAMDREPTDRELSGGIISSGLSSALGAFIGGLPLATYSQNVGIFATTKVVNRHIVAVTALILLVAGLLPKFAALLTTIPPAVIGGATLSVFAAITMTGMKLILSAGLSARNSAVAGIAVALGVGVSQVANVLAGPGIPPYVHQIFGTSSVIIATLVAVILNIAIPRDKAARGCL
ncbi:MAG: solute carrier family 23 protein [Cloacibacillus sp.]